MRFVGSEVTTQDYRDSISAPDTNQMFTLAYQWQDKPHRHVFDLCDEIDRPEPQLSTARAALKEIAEYPHCNATKVDDRTYVLRDAFAHAEDHRCAAAIAKKALSQKGEKA